MQKMFFYGGPPVPPAVAAPLDPAYFWIEGPSRNRLASTAYLATNPTRSFARSTVKYKIDHNSKTKNRTEKTQEYINSDQDIAYLAKK